MPLPAVEDHGAAQCRARSKRSGERCLNPAAHGMKVCRMHGARRAHTTLRGEKHPAYKHGRETSSMRFERALASARLAVLEGVGFALGMMNGSRTRGRKPHQMTAVFPELHIALFALRVKDDQSLVGKRQEPTRPQSPRDFLILGK